MFKILNYAKLNFKVSLCYEHFASDQPLCLDISFCLKMPVFGAKSSI
jgi:hypothetical protein